MEQLLIGMDEASKLTGFSKSTLYKLTSKRKIPFYKPFGKKIFFSREQIESMLRKNIKETIEIMQVTLDSNEKARKYDN